MAHSDLSVFAGQADGTFRFYRMITDSFYCLDLIRIKLQQVGVDYERQINSNLLELKSVFKSAKLV